MIFMSLARPAYDFDFKKQICIKQQEFDTKNQVVLIIELKCQVKLQELEINESIKGQGAMTIVLL